MLKQNLEPVRRIVHSAYDFEWDQDKVTGELTITLCGALDEKGYRAYPNCLAFIRGELTQENAGRFYYAHFGGASDMVFLLKELIRDPRLEIKGVFSGSSAIFITVQKGKNKWHFCDSFWLMRTKLANIGEHLGFPKLSIDFEKCTARELRTYNERDCLILYKAIEQFQETIISHGGELGITAASTAMRTFLRRFLKSDLDNRESENDYSRPAYVASRVEKIRDSCKEANVYDINSSFPFSFTFDNPGRVIGHSKKAIEKEGSLWLADVEISSDTYLPTIPIRSASSGRIFFPNGVFRCRISSEDAKAGGFDIRRVFHVREYEPRDDLKEFAEVFYALRKGSSGFASEVFKILLNSLYTWAPGVAQALAGQWLREVRGESGKEDAQDSTGEGPPFVGSFSP